MERNRNFQKFQTKIQTNFLEIYKQLNKKLFDNSLPLCQIAFYPISDSYGEVYVDVCVYDNSVYPFLVLNPEFFKKGVHFMVGILIHEMVHIHCFKNGITEINYKTGYHNIRFKQECEKINLKCVKDGSYGYNQVSLTPELKITVNEILKKVDLVNTLSKYSYNI